METRHLQSMAKTTIVNDKGVYVKHLYLHKQPANKTVEAYQITVRQGCFTPLHCVTLSKQELVTLKDCIEEILKNSSSCE